MCVLMNEDCLISINYDFMSHVATLIYEPDSEYDLTAIGEYVEDMTEGKCQIIDIYEGKEHAYRLGKPAQPIPNGSRIAWH